MSKGRISGDGRKTRRSPVKKKVKKAVPKKTAAVTAPTAATRKKKSSAAKIKSTVSEKKSIPPVFSSLQPSFHPQNDNQVHRFIGLSLGGGKTDKACLAVVEFFPQHKKVFLSRLVERIKSDEVHSADFKVQEIVEQYHGQVDSLAYDVPFRLPLSLEACVQGRPSIDEANAPHLKWMWDYTRKLHKKKKPRKLFTPYTQRCVEMYLTTEIEEPFHLPHAMGANAAPLLARSMYLQNILKLPAIEVFPKLSLWRIGRSLQINKNHLRFHKHSFGGDESRRVILQSLSAHNVVFVYDQDIKLMIENNHAFEAFVCALTAFLKFKGLTESRPDGFPEDEDWVEFPKAAIKWDSF